MENIISQNNGKVRTVVRLLSGPKERKYLGRYVVEGTRMVREIPDKDLDSIFMTQAYVDKTMNEDSRIRNLVEKAVLRSRCYIVTEPIIRKMSDTRHPQGIIATVNTILLMNCSRRVDQRLCSLFLRDFRIPVIWEPS